jgi:hypothetical protein
LTKRNKRLTEFRNTQKATFWKLIHEKMHFKDAVAKNKNRHRNFWLNPADNKNKLAQDQRFSIEGNRVADYLKVIHSQKPGWSVRLVK